MSKCHILEPQLRDMFFRKWHMFHVSAMSKQNIVCIRLTRSHAFQNPSSVRRMSIAVSADTDIQILKIHACRLIPWHHDRITLKCICLPCGTRINIVLIASNNYRLCIWNLPKLEIQFLQILFRRLCVKQISRNQKQFNFLFFAYLNHTVKGTVNLLCPHIAPDSSAIWLRAQIDICYMYEFHSVTLPPCRLSCSCTSS